MATCATHHQRRRFDNAPTPPDRGGAAPPLPSTPPLRPLAPPLPGPPAHSISEPWSFDRLPQAQPTTQHPAPPPSDPRYRTPPPRTFGSDPLRYSPAPLTDGLALSVPCSQAHATSTLLSLSAGSATPIPGGLPCGVETSGVCLVVPFGVASQRTESRMWSGSGLLGEFRAVHCHSRMCSGSKDTGKPVLKC